MLWEISEENWKSVLRGLEKTKIKFMIASALVFNQEQPWYTLNIMCMIITMSIMTVFVFIGSMSIYHARNDLLTFVEIAHAYSFIVALWGLLLLQFTSKVATVYELLRLLDTDVFVYKTVHGREDDEKIKSNMKKFSNIFQKLFHTALAVAASMLVVVTPLLLNIFGEGDRPKIKGINYKLPIPFWFPFNTDTRTGFTVAYLLLTGEICVVLFYVAVALPFLVYLALEVGVQFKILHDSILNIEPRAIERYRSFKCSENTEDAETLGEDPLFQMCVRECLKENILHHIQIIRFFKLFQNVTSAIFGVSILVSMIFLASLSLVLTKIELFSFDAVKFTFFFLMELSFAFGYCFMGTSLTEASKQIPTALYDCPWFKLFRKEEKKTLLIFEMNTAKSLVLKGNGLFVIDLQLFVQIARTTYSIFNIFSSSENKQ